jgi:hypothetical protein
MRRHHRRARHAAGEPPAIRLKARLGHLHPPVRQVLHGRLAHEVGEALG